jgi:hypothetical protein
VILQGASTINLTIAVKRFVMSLEFRSISATYPSEKPFVYNSSAQTMISYDDKTSFGKDTYAFCG